MVSEEFKTIIIKPDEGKFLTQKGDVEIDKRIISTMLALGRFDSVDNYIEIDKETADKYKEEQEKARENKSE